MKLGPAVGLVVLGTIFIIAGALLPVLFPSILNYKLDEMFALRSDSPTIGNFIDPPIIIHQDIYFFNVTNKDDILKGHKPRVEEVGPFAYVEKNTKVDLTWDTLKGTVTFRKNETFYFVPELSDGLSEDTLITTINPVLLALASMAENPSIPEAAHAVLEMYLWRFNMEPFITRPAGELLFHGYREDVVLALSTFTKNTVHATGKFGFFYPKNNSLTPFVKVNTGVYDINKLMKLLEINGETQMTAWKTDECNAFNGNLGAPFPRPITKDFNLSLFSIALCREIYFSYEEDVTIGKLNLYRYGLPYELLAKNKENECFCYDKFTCRASMAYLAPCRNGAPMMASYPHFYMASQEDIDSIDGLHPERERHRTYVDIEPTTGISLRGKKRVQINMPLRHYANLPSLKDVREVVFPILWIDHNVEAPSEAAELIYNKAILPAIILKYVCYVLIAVGALLIVVTVVLYFRTVTVEKNSKPQANVKVTVRTSQDGKNIELQKPFINNGID